VVSRVKEVGEPTAGMSIPTIHQVSPGSPWRRFATRMMVWRSPPDQPQWARPILLAIAASAGLSYAWGMTNFPLEPFYGAAARTMGANWRDFFFGAVDPAGTTTLDKLPGAIWVQALDVRLFGFHYWTVALPQVIAGVLSILVLYRAVHRMIGPKAGLIAALIVAASPVNALLNRGNVSDSILVLLTVLAADATGRAVLTGRPQSLLLAGLWIGLAFQTKMLQAWLVVPALFVTYAVAAPPSLRRRLVHVAMASLVTVVVSLSWMSVVSTIPGHDRPFVDGTTNDSVYSQVFVYNGWARIGVHVGADTSVHGVQPFVRAILEESTQVGTFAIAASPQRLLVGPLGRDDAWLLPAALVSGVGVLLARRSKSRRDPIRALVMLWSGWLVILGLLFSFGEYVNSYYTGVLIPAVAALCATGLAVGWRASSTSRMPRVLLAILAPLTGLYAIALIPSGAGVRTWLVPLIVGGCVLAVAVLIVSVRTKGLSATRGGTAFSLAAVSMLLAPAVTTGVVVSDGLGSFSTPYQSAAATQRTTVEPEEFQAQAARESAYFDRFFGDNQIVYAVDTAAVASPFIMVTGKEFLPIGGFSGNSPSPTLAHLRHLIEMGRLHTFLIPVRPPGNDSRLDWIRRYCSPGVNVPDAHGVVLRYYHC
jgi:4-amino-4-deoxy-L-arabinose transferase-like glycosyltransferase